MLKKILQILFGVLSSIVVNVLSILPYFFFALDVLKGYKNYTVAEFANYTTYKNMILIPLSYTIILGLACFLIYKFINFKYFSITFFVIGMIITWSTYLMFPSIIWF